ncbi:MAG: hypothetical protein JWM32_123 [Verrucomicrobia bacterium]|nr:hypothetical protein [Verrucomicrobiota bacterium]
MSEEMALHLELQTEANIGAGMTRDEARYAALREFGHVEGIKERARDQRGVSLLEQLAQDFRYGARQLRKAPGFTLIAALTLAVGIGATTAIFSIVNSVALRPLAYPESGRLVAIQEVVAATGRDIPTSPAMLLTWQKQASDFQSLTASCVTGGNLTGVGAPVRLFGNSVAPNYFTTLDVLPIVGRNFRAGDSEEGKAPAIILTYELWATQFEAKPEVVGRTILLNNEPRTVIGVMPPKFKSGAGGPQYYDLLVRNRAIFGARYLTIIGRLKSAATVEHAAGQLSAISEHTQQVFLPNDDLGLKITPLLESKVGGVKPLLFVLLGAVGFLLLIACVNVANLLLARAASRQKEIALRVALGASRSRVVRQLLAESLLTAAIGGVLGVLLTYATMAALLGLAPLSLPRLEEVRIDGLALAFTSAVTLLTGLGFGLVPALQATRLDLTAALKEGGRGAGDGRGRRRLRHSLVVAEVSLALVLLVGAGLLARSFSQIQRTDLGYDPTIVYVSRVSLLLRQYPDDPARIAFADRALAQLSSQPGIEAAAFATAFPHHQNPAIHLAIDRHPETDLMKMPVVSFSSVTPDFFRAMSNRRVAGRWFTAGDRAGSPPVAIVSEETARQFFPEGSPIGRRVAIVWPNEREWREIVGVVADLKTAGPTQTSLPQVYLPFAQKPGMQFMMVIQVKPDAPNPAPQVTAAIQKIDPDIPVPRKMVCIAEYVANSVAIHRFTLFLFSVFSGFALLLAAIGIYGVMAYSVTQRTGEIGIRIALGAQRADIMRLVVGQGGRLILWGILLGLAAAVSTSHLLGAVLVGVAPHDPTTLLVVAAILGSVAFLASWLPARRATQVDPMVALRAE